MNLMEDFKKAKQAIYDHVGFVEDWVVYPIEDRTECYWKITKKNKEVKFAYSVEQFNSSGDYYVDEIYTQRFYKRWIYEGEELTMIFVDTHTDGNKFFAIFSNEKRIK